jgi:hypothetical protein
MLNGLIIGISLKLGHHFCGLEFTYFCSCIMEFAFSVELLVHLVLMFNTRLKISMGLLHLIFIFERRLDILNRELEIKNAEALFTAMVNLYMPVG